MKRYLIVALVMLCAASAYGFHLIGSGVASAPGGGTIDLSLATAAVAYDSGVENTTCSAPTGTSDGDFLLAVMYSDGAAAVTPPSGWTQIGTTQAHPDETNLQIRVWYKRASSEGASWTWTHAALTRSMVVWRITGVVSSGDPEDATRYTGTQNWDGGTSTTWTSITTGTNGAAVVAIRTQNDDSTVSSASMTERYDANNKIVIIGDTQATAGASGNESATESAAGQRIKIMIALKPGS